MSEIVDCIAYVVQKTCWSLGVFALFVAKRLADLFGLIFNVLACLTIIRLPYMVLQFIDMDEWWKWRCVGFIHFIFFLVDIPFILMALFMILFTGGFILIPVIREIKEEVDMEDLKSEDHGIYGFAAFQLHAIIGKNFFRLICDILCVPLAIICFFSWRCCIFVKKLRKKDYKWQDFGWRKVCIIQFLQLLVDIPCILIGLLVMITWRAPFLGKRVKELKKDDEKWNWWRFEVFPEFALIFVDFVCLLLFALAIITWRAPFLIYELYHVKKTQWKVREKIAEQVLLIFVDIPCILCVLIVFVTLWRVPNFIRDWKSDQWKIRQNCVCQLGMLLIDFGCFLLCVVVIVTIWRIYPLICDVRKYYSRPREERSWKIRKSICKNVAFLLVDIPAIFLCFILLITMFRFPKLLSKLIQTGNFFMEFAITVYFEAAMLVVDIFFIILFVVLMCLRPIQSWVHLLEDEEHKKNRILRHYMQWVPDILEKRFQARREMEGIFSTCLKNRLQESKLREHLTVVSEEYLEELEWIRGKVRKYELEEGFSHLINMVKWWEKKRVNKLLRLYRCELNFLLHPNVSTHNNNLSKFRNEMIRYESHVSEQIRAIEKYTIPKVPLWSEECGLKTRTRKETQQALIKCLPSGRFVLSLLILLNLALIYRGPSLLKNLCRRWYDRRNIVFNSCKEYLYDFITICQILLVLIFVYRAPFLITDITRDIVFKQSWRAVRESVRKYPPMILEDLVELLRCVFSWESVRFLFTALLFGLLMPADLFLTIMKFLCSKDCAIFMTAILYVIFMAFPFLIPFYISGKLEPSTLTIVIGAFAIVLLMALVMMVVVLLKNKDPVHNRQERDEGLLIQPTPYDYIRFNWTNVHVIVFEIVEFLQLLALVFILSDIPMPGADTLNTASQYLLLNFASFNVKLWLTFCIFVIWFFCCGAPVILESVLEYQPKGSCAKHVGWTLFLSLFANTMFVTIVESFLTFVACKSNDCPAINTTAGANYSSDCLPAVLYEDPSMECWEGSHKSIALLGLLGLVWYSTTAIIFGTKYGDVEHPNQDLKFSPVYNIFLNFAKALMVGVVVLAQAKPMVVLTILLLANVGAIIFTLVFKRIFGFHLSNSLVLVIWRAVTFICGGVAAASALVAKTLNDPDSMVPLVIFLGGCLVVVLVAFIVSMYLRNRRTPVENQRRTFRQQLLALEAKLVQENYMINSWSKGRAQWKRLVSNVYEAQKADRGVSPSVWSHLEIPTAPPPPEVMPEAGLSTSAPLPPPPAYDDLFPNIMGPYGVPPVPPPPYSERSPDLKTSLPWTNRRGSHSKTPASNLEAAEQTEPTEFYDIGRAVTPAPPPYYVADEWDTFYSPPENRDEWKLWDINSMECNGTNLLLVLEGYIHYSAFSFSFILQLPLWRSAVRACDWTGLLHCLRVLEGSLNGQFNNPTQVDVSLGNVDVPLLELEPDVDTEEPPFYEPESRDPEVIRAQSDGERTRAVDDVKSVGEFGEQWAELLDKVLPTKPVIRKWLWDQELGEFHVYLRRPIQGVITEVGPRGIKMARGASIALPKHIKGRLSGTKITFEKGCEPKGKKGPVSVAVAELGIMKIEEKMYVTAQEKKVPYDKALDSMKTVTWK
ncbi:hypothetical protein ACROYT_G024206 [Oculina patagonica]